MRRHPLVAIGLAFAALAPTIRGARAQTRRFADEPTAGLALPMNPLAGDHDATAIATNPAGLLFLGGAHFEVAFTGLSEEHAHAPGAGLGFFLGAPAQVPLGPRFGFGLGVEYLAPPRVTLAPDPGQPVRVSLATAWSLGRAAALGLAWRKFVEDEAPVGGLSSWDLGLAARFGRHVAAGAVVRDLFTPTYLGVPVQRRYEAELTARPTGTSRLELALGGGVGERRHDLDGWARAGVRVARGVVLRAEVASRARLAVEDPALPMETESRRELVGSLGVELSFGALGAAAYATASRDVDGEGRLLGGTAVVRLSAERYPSLLPRPARIERLKLEGALSERELLRVALRLRRLERDEDVRAVFLAFDGLSVGWAGAQELRDAILRLRARGKKVFVYLVAGTSREYYIAAAADKILLDEAGGVRLVGMAASVLFFKDFFDKVGVVAQFEKIEEYKSAPEAFTMSGSSEPARRMRDELYGGVWDRFLADLAKDRGGTPEAWAKLVDEGPFTAKEAGEKKLVDAVGDPLALDAAVGQWLGRRYAVSDGEPAERRDAWDDPELAIVYIEGDIVDGKSMTIPFLGMKLAGGETIAQAIAWARESPRIKAIVLRIDSPGGSALASDLIAREVKKTRGKKPIVVSMGDIAASGGYFAAAYGDWIFAEPSTITGSIGIFTGKFDLSQLLRDAGLTWETWRRGAHADMESYLRPYTDEERRAIKEKLRYYYEQFTGAVAAGRGMTMSEVDAVGRGRVWTGEQALKIKLVDQLGGLVDAIADAKRRAGIGEDELVQVVLLPQESAGLLGTILKLAGGGARARDAAPSPADPLRALFPASLLLGPGTPLARLPFVIAWE